MYKKGDLKLVACFVLLVHVGVTWLFPVDQFCFFRCSLFHYCIIKLIMETLPCNTVKRPIVKKAPSSSRDVEQWIQDMGLLDFLEAT